MSIHSLKSILSTFTTKDGNKRILFDGTSIGGLSSNIVKTFIISLPFIEYGILFHTSVFDILGIATAITFFIVFLSVIMLITFYIVWNTKKSVIKKITPSWNHYFNEINIEMVLSTTTTPYSDFFKYYSSIINENLDDEKTQKYLLKAFETMETDNKDLLESMNRNK